MPGNVQGFLDGFQAQLTAPAQITDQTLSFPTSGMIPGLRYQFRIDDTNPPTTFEYVEVQYQDPSTAAATAAPGGRGIGGTSATFHNTGAWVTSIFLKESLLPTFARLDTENLMSLASASDIAGQRFSVYGMPGAVQPTRYVGATTGGAPTTGAFLTGDFVLDATNGVIWLCIASGSPGTWQNILDGTNTGLTGAVSSLTRWVGATGGGPPLAGTWKQGDVVTDRQGVLWVCTTPGTPGTWQAPPLGTLAGGYAQITANQGPGFGAEAPIVGLSVNVTVGTGRRIRVTGYISSSTSSVSGDFGSLRIKEGATQLQREDIYYGSIALGLGVNASVVLQPSAGAHTYNLAFARPGGSGNITLFAGAVNPCFILVEDIGI